MLPSHFPVPRTRPVQQDQEDGGWQRHVSLQAVIQGTRAHQALPHSQVLQSLLLSYDATDAPTLVLQNVDSSFQQAFPFSSSWVSADQQIWPFHPQTSLTLLSSLQQTTDIGLTQNSGDTGLCFEIWFRKRKTQDTYTLQAVSPDVKEAWTRDLERILWEQAVHNRGRNRTRSGDKLGIFLC